MTPFFELSANARTALLTLLLCAVLGVLFLLLSKAIRTGRIKLAVPDCCMFAVLTFAIALLGPDSTSRTYDNIPTAFVVLLLLAAAAYVAVEAMRERKRHRTELSANAIKQAFDDLPTGVCFADETGRIILINRAMGELGAVLTGSYPQTIWDLTDALKDPPKGCGVTRLEPNPPLCRFPDGRVWQFQTTALEGIDGVTQILAQNVTELYEGNARLQRDNAELRRVIAKLRKMFQRLSERIREKETLELKMRIHNNIGASLIAISEMMNGGGDGDVEHQLAVLKDAISYFSNDFPAARGTFEEARQKAAEMHVTLELDGYIPQNPDMERLIAAAARECVTNCVNHAGGDRVRVEVVERADIYRVIITNNGKIPEREITEGGGLSSLRRSVEGAGGEMSVSHRPAFALILNLPRREQEL